MPPQAGESPLPATASGIAFVLGAHANEPAPVIDPAFGPMVDSLIAARGRASIVVNDGAPFTALDTGLGGPCSEDGCKVVHDRSITQLRQGFTAAKARTPQSDLLAAIAVAGRTTDRSGVIAVCDSGLSTSGAVMFQTPGMLTASPTDIVQYLTDTNQLIALSGQTVVLACMGDTAPPQQPLTDPQRRAVITAWTAVLKASGAGQVLVLDRAVTGGPVNPVPDVSTVPLPAAPTIELPPPPTTVPPATVPPTTATGSAAPRPPVVIAPRELTEDNLPFVPDQAQLLDPAGARRLLEPLATYLIDNNMYARLTGTTSSAGTPQGRTDTSTARTGTVRDVLVDLGVPRDHISTRGVGCDWPGYLPDRDANNVLEPGPAAKNRKVIVDITSQPAA